MAVLPLKEDGESLYAGDLYKILYWNNTRTPFGVEHTGATLSGIVNYHYPGSNTSNPGEMFHHFVKVTWMIEGAPGSQLIEHESTYTQLRISGTSPAINFVSPANEIRMDWPRISGAGVATPYVNDNICNAVGFMVLTSGALTASGGNVGSPFDITVMVRATDAVAYADARHHWTCIEGV
jgi:hypothetical protein